MSKKPISFGTSGHRGIIGKDFTLQHVKAIAKSVADYVKSISTNPRIALGYDPRKGNSPDLEDGSFTKAICDVLAYENVEVDFFDFYSPTPVVAWHIPQAKLDGGIILTASHNPPEYNGIKFNLPNGAPSNTEITKIIEDKANEYFEEGIASLDFTTQVKDIDIKKEFVADLLEKLDKITGINIKNLDFPIAIDAKHGTVGSYWDAIFNTLGITNFVILDKEPQSDFGNIEPNPTKPNSLNELKKKQKELKSPIAIANDPDGDRHVVLDENGDLVTPEEVTAIIFDYLMKKNQPMLGVATTVASSMIVRSVVEKNNKEYCETAVGFKYFCDFLEKARKENKISLAVESSGGFTASFHVLEKCGFLPALFLLYILKDSKLRLSELKNKIFTEYGKFYFKEEEYHFKPEQKPALIQLFQDLTKDKIENLTGLKIKELNKLDGLKIILDNAWVLMRLSGTEPVARIYAEALKETEAEKLLNVAKKLI